MVVIVSFIAKPPGVAPMFDVHFELGDTEGLSVLYHLQKEDERLKPPRPRRAPMDPIGRT